jgi:ribosomal protein S18 acetylase RimI-like enzyme
MISIQKATTNNVELLAALGRTTFIESHGSSASKAIIDAYVNEKYTPEIFQKELAAVNHQIFIIYYHQKVVGYSKIIWNNNLPSIALQPIAKLERLYILKEYYGLKIGKALFEFNINLAQQQHQKGIWLYVWTENKRAISFYQKAGFEIIGSYHFHLTATHANPNHQLLMSF